MAVAVRWPDINVVFRDILAPLVGLANIGLETPADLADRDQFLRVRKVDGANTEFDDLPVVAVDAFAPTYVAAEALAEQARQTLMARRPHPRVDVITCLASPTEVEWGDGRGIRRFAATYDAVTRRHTTT